MNTPFGLANLWLEGDSITRFVALALLLCSIVTWVILLSRFWDLRNLRKLSPELDKFWRATSFDQGLYSLTNHGTNPYYHIAKSALDASAAGNTTFTVTSNSSWIVSSDQTWCTVTPSGNGNGPIQATYTENTTANTRVAGVTVTVAGLSPVVVMVTQAGITPTLIVTPSNQDVTAPAGNTSFSVTSNSSWTVSSDQGWCNVTPSGTGSGTLSATYQENVLTTQRIANITVLVNGLGPIVVTVTQGGATPTLLVTPSGRIVPVAAGTTNFSVASNSNWSAISDASWCVVTSSGSGNGTIDAVYQQNTGMNPRTALITVTVNGVTPVMVTVFQEGLVGVAEPVLSNILVFPNPTTGKVTLLAPDRWLAAMDVEVVSLDGKVVLTASCAGKDSYTFDLSGQAKGVYLLKIITAEGTEIRKIILD